MFGTSPNLTSSCTTPQAAENRENDFESPTWLRDPETLVSPLPAGRVTSPPCDIVRFSPASRGRLYRKNFRARSATPVNLPSIADEEVSYEVSVVIGDASRASTRCDDSIAKGLSQCDIIPLQQSAMRAYQQGSL
eukprot:sb/3474682/